MIEISSDGPVHIKNDNKGDTKLGRKEKYPYYNEAKISVIKIRIRSNFV